MKKIAFWNNYTNFSHNQAFNPNAYGIGEDLGYPIILLKEKLFEKGYILETLDMDEPENYDAVIFCDVPNPNTCCVDLSRIPKRKKYLFIAECEKINKNNGRKDLLNDFEVVFAYNDDLIATSGYKKLNLTNKMKNPLNIDFHKKSFSVIIAGNKSSMQKGELYSERLKAIKFMEKKHPKDFDLYGIGWDLKYFTGIRPIRALNHFNFIRKIFTKKRKSYKGKIDKKIKVLSQYKFCFCYENFKTIPGYITEKIWDCFFAGCIPVYYGAPNILNYIPDNCFIDFRNFSSYEDLYNFLNSIDQKKYEEYISNITKFLQTEKAYTFSADYFVESIMSEIIK